MNKNRTADHHDTKTDVKVVLAGLWTSMLFVFAYVDIFGFWRADVINGALLKKVPGVAFEIGQAFLGLTTAYILVPSLMIIVSLLAPAKISRTTNILVSAIYAVSVALSLIGETWVYYILGSVVEVALLLAIARTAWTWPTRSSTPIGVPTPWSQSPAQSRIDASPSTRRMATRNGPVPDLPLRQPRSAPSGTGARGVTIAYLVNGPDRNIARAQTEAGVSTSRKDEYIGDVDTALLSAPLVSGSDNNHAHLGHRTYDPTRPGTAKWCKVAKWAAIAAEVVAAVVFWESTIWGLAVGAAAGMAVYAASHVGTKHFRWSGLARSAFLGAGGWMLLLIARIARKAASSRNIQRTARPRPWDAHINDEQSGH